jgi:hypothetical protein
MCESVDRASHILILNTNQKSTVNFTLLLFYTLVEERLVPTGRTAFPNLAVNIEGSCLCRSSNPGHLAGCIYTGRSKSVYGPDDYSKKSPQN